MEILYLAITEDAFLKAEDTFIHWSGELFFKGLNAFFNKITQHYNITPGATT